MLIICNHMNISNCKLIIDSFVQTKIQLLFIIHFLTFEINSRNLEKFLALLRKQGFAQRQTERKQNKKTGIGEIVHRNIRDWIARFIVDCRSSFRLTIHFISLGTILKHLTRFLNCSLVVNAATEVFYFLFPFLSFSLLLPATSAFV